jgi:tetraacyldisaccharide 4'-kinase
MLTEAKFREIVASESWVRSVLRRAGDLYGFLIVLRHWAYDREWLQQKKVSVPVVSIGNIVAGGTGKTPLVHLLAQELSAFAKMAVLSRGYRSKREYDQATRVTSAALSEECGDEPCLLAEKLPQAMVFVGKDRYSSARSAIDQGAQLIILDDGMQHRQLARDFEVVVMDAQDPFGQGHYLPGGFLRDSPKRLQNADLIVLTNVHETSQYEILKKQIAFYSSAPLVGMQLTASEESSFVRGKRVGVFCGIGNPDRFTKTIERLEGQIVDTCFANDHVPFSKNQLEVFAKHCHEQGAELLVCTEKDWVKLPPGLQLVLPVDVIKVGLTVVAGSEHWHQFIDRIRKKI